MVPEGYQMSGLYYLGNGEDLSAQKMESVGQACLDAGWWKIVAKMETPEPV